MPRSMPGREFSFRSRKRKLRVAWRRDCSSISASTLPTERERNVRPLAETTSEQKAHFAHWQPRPVIIGTMRTGYRSHGKSA